MPLQSRKIAVKIAVLFFFIFSLSALAVGVSPYTCCKRALAGAFITYLLTVLVVRIINTVLMDAMISKFLNKHINEEHGH